jgi:hypothetical protein
LDIGVRGDRRLTRVPFGAGAVNGSAEEILLPPPTRTGSIAG